MFSRTLPTCGENWRHAIRIFLFLKKKKIVFLGGGRGGGEDEWVEMNKVFFFLVVERKEKKRKKKSGLSYSFCIWLQYLVLRYISVFLECVWLTEYMILGGATECLLWHAMKLANWTLINIGSICHDANRGFVCTVQVHLQQYIVTYWLYHHNCFFLFVIFSICIGNRGLKFHFTSKIFFFVFFENR